MNRLTRLILPAVLALTVLIPSLAHAGWVTKEIFWNKSRIGGVDGTSVVVKDTTFQVLDATADTTGKFSINDADPIRGYAATTANTDTVLLGFLVFQSDTSVVAAPNITLLTVNIDGRIGGFGTAVQPTQLAAWTQIDSMQVQTASDAKTYQIAVPVRAIGTLANPVLTASPYSREYKALAMNELRARVLIATGSTTLPAARAFFRYWKNEKD